MNDFKKTVRLGTVRIDDKARNVFCKIEYAGGRLSISGVEGPMPDGNAHGSCGQIDMHLRGRERDIKAAPGWNLALLRRFFEVWGEWHLNDMRAYDAEMKAAGWDELAKKEMRGYEFTLTNEVLAAQGKLRQDALAALHLGAMVQYPPDERRIANLPYSYKQWVYADEPSPQPREGYQRAKDHKGNVKPVERKTLGWLYPTYKQHLREDWHPDGLLGRKLREDGPGYGSSWFRQDVPEDVLEFLKGLPDTDITPAWV